MPELMHTDTEVAAALNKACDDILDATGAEDEGLRDALNLMVNATADYLSGKAQDLHQVAELNYEADLGTILGWIAQGVR